MASEVLMPALSPTMTEGKIARWLKSEGEKVSAGDVLAEIETNKATMEVEAVDEGVLAQIVIPEGTEHVAVNTPIAVIAADGEDPASPAPGPNGRADGGRRCAASAGAAAGCRAGAACAHPSRADGRARIRRRHPHDDRTRSLRDAIAEEMRRDDTVFLLGEEVGEYQGAYKVSQGCSRSSGRAGSSTRRSPSRGLPGSGSARALPGCARSSSS